MERLLLNQDVYIINETFNPRGFKITKCKVTAIPHKGLNEYKLNDKGHLYFTKRMYIYETYPEAVEHAEKEADDYDKVWEPIMKRRVKRYWRE